MDWVPTRLRTEDLRGKTGLWLLAGQPSCSVYFLSSAECMFSSSILTLEQSEPTGSHCSSEGHFALTTLFSQISLPTSSSPSFLPTPILWTLVYNPISLIIPKLHFFPVMHSVQQTGPRLQGIYRVRGGLRYGTHWGAQRTISIGGCTCLLLL